ncbi:MAG: hypothetical protein AABO58_24400 [Acidobacteriota bacterium]
MNRILLLLSVVILIIACNKAPEQTTSATAPPTATTAPTAASATSEAAPAAASATSAPAAAAPAAAGAIATQETNWKGISAAVTEFRRKGNTLTAKVQIVNHGLESPQAEVKFDEVYLIDTSAGKKYNVLRDEKGAYIASLRSGWGDRWYDTMKPGESYLLWMKFPAPPPEVKVISLQLPSTPPFEDLNIQE